MTAVTNARVPRYVCVPEAATPWDMTVHQTSSATCDWAAGLLRIITVCGASLGTAIWLAHRDDELPGLPCEKCQHSLERTGGKPRWKQQPTRSS